MGLRQRCWCGCVLLAAIVGWHWAGNAGAGLLALWVGCQPQQPPLVPATAPDPLPAWVWLCPWALVYPGRRILGIALTVHLVFVDELSGAKFAALRRQLMDR